MMDNYDLLLCLSFLLSRNRSSEKDQYVKQIESCLSLFQPNSKIEPNELDVIQNSIKETENFLKVNISELLKSKLTKYEMPKSLYISNALGSIEYEKVSSSTTFQIRGKSYLSDSKKIDSQGSLFYLRGIQVIRSESFVKHVAPHDWCIFPKHENSNQWLIVNYMIPGTTCVHVIALFAAIPLIQQALLDFKEGRPIDPSFEPDQKAYIKCIRQFWTGDQTYCDNTFKLIPNVVEGSWAIKMAVGQRPALTGKKVSQFYFKGNNYLEVDIDISSSTIAMNILGLVRGVSKSMVVDLGITIQGESEDELPEAILCSTRFDKVDLENSESI